VLAVNVVPHAELIFCANPPSDPAMLGFASANGVIGNTAENSWSFTLDAYATTLIEVSAQNE
jgi:hypothetical protein